MFWMIIWGIVFAVTVIAEIITLQLVSIWFSAGALAAFTSAALGFEPLPQAIIFTAVSVLLLCVTRPILRKIRVQNVLPTNADAEVGRLAVVTEDIDDARDTGRVKIGGVNWRARTENEHIIAAGTSVRVEKISGTTAYVTEIEAGAM